MSHPNPLFDNPEQAISHLAAIVESSHDAIVSKTPEGTVLTWNSGAESIYGYSAAEAAGREMTFLLPPDRHDEERNLLERIRQGRRVEPFETVRLRKDGRPIHVSLRIFPVYDSAGRIVAISHIARDMTERVQGEAAFEAQLRQVSPRWRPESRTVLITSLPSFSATPACCWRMPTPAISTEGRSPVSSIPANTPPISPGSCLLMQAKAWWS